MKYFSFVIALFCYDTKDTKPVECFVVFIRNVSDSIAHLPNCDSFFRSSKLKTTPFLFRTPQISGLALGIFSLLSKKDCDASEQHVSKKSGQGWRSGCGSSSAPKFYDFEKQQQETYTDTNDNHKALITIRFLRWREFVYLFEHCQSFWRNKPKQGNERFRTDSNVQNSFSRCNDRA